MLNANSKNFRGKCQITDKAISIIVIYLAH